MNMLIALATTNVAKLLFWLIFFTHVNQLNGSTQEKEKIFLDILKSSDVFTAKVELRIHRMGRGELATFQH